VDIKTVHPLNDRVLLKLAKRKEKSDGGIFLPNKPSVWHSGTVVAKGPGKIDKRGRRISPAVEIGQVAVFQALHLTKIADSWEKIEDDNGDTYVMVVASEIEFCMGAN
jgi:co-chaperonin GroES (HSP10)